MAERVPTVSIVIRDEATAALDRIKRQFVEQNRENKQGFVKEVNSLEVIAFSTSREFGATVGAMGAKAAFVTGGIVASVAAMTAALANFARGAQQARYIADEIGITQKQLYQLQYAFQQRGVERSQALQGIHRLGLAVKELTTYGVSSDTMERLKKIGGPYGAQFGLDIMRFYETNGKSAIKTMLEVLGRLGTDEGASEDETAWMHEIVARSFNIDTTALGGITEDELSDFAKAAEDNKEQTDKFIETLVRLQSELSQLQNSLGVALLGPMTELFDTLNTAVSGKDGERFKKWLVETVQKLDQIPWGAVRQSVSDALPQIKTAIRSFLGNMPTVVENFTRIGRTVARWAGHEIRPVLSGTPWGGDTAGKPGLPGSQAGPPVEQKPSDAFKHLSETFDAAIEGNKLQGAVEDEKLPGAAEEDRLEEDDTLPVKAAPTSGVLGPPPRPSPPPPSRIMSALRAADVMRQGGIMAVGERYYGAQWPAWMQGIADVARSPLMGYAGYATPGMITPGLPAHKGAETVLEGLGGAFTWGGRFYDQWRRSLATGWRGAGVSGGWNEHRALATTQRRRQSKSGIIEQTKQVKEQIQDLNDWLRVHREGVGGGNVEGGVTEAGRNRPFETEAGGAGGPPALEQRDPRPVPPGAKFNPWTGEKILQIPPDAKFNPYTGEKLQPPFTGQPWGGETAGVRGSVGGPSGSLDPQSQISALAAGSGSATTRLGLQRIKPFTYEQIYANPEILKEHFGIRYSHESVMGQMRSGNLLGFTMPGKPGVAYDPSTTSGQTVLAHEAGHAGRVAVSEAAKTDPNIFTRYAFQARTHPTERLGRGTVWTGTKISVDRAGRPLPGKTPLGSHYTAEEFEERQQRALDLLVTKNLGESGAVPWSAALAQRERAIDYLSDNEGRVSRKEFEDLARHEAMTDVYAQRLLQQRETPSLKLNISVSTPADEKMQRYNSEVDGTLIDDSVSLARERQLEMQ